MLDATRASLGEEAHLQRPGHCAQGLKAARAKNLAQPLRNVLQATLPQLPKQLEHPADLYVVYRRGAPLQGS